MTAGCGIIHLRGWLRMVVAVGAALFLFSIVYGPYLSYTTQQNTNKTVNFIHEVQTSPAAKTSRDASAWEVKSIEALCAKTGAPCPPLPKDVASSLRAD